MYSKFKKILAQPNGQSNVYVKKRILAVRLWEPELLYL